MHEGNQLIAALRYTGMSGKWIRHISEILRIFETVLPCWLLYHTTAFHLYLLCSSTFWTRLALISFVLVQLPRPPPLLLCFTGGGQRSLPPGLAIAWNLSSIAPFWCLPDVQCPDLHLCPISSPNSQVCLCCSRLPPFLISDIAVWRPGVAVSHLYLLYIQLIGHIRVYIASKYSQALHDLHREKEKYANCAVRYHPPSDFLVCIFIVGLWGLPDQSAQKHFKQCWLHYSRTLYVSVPVR